ncbi:MAG: hypothetical protein ACTSX8_02770 [Alphaproteobacteria bacterium]
MTCHERLFLDPRFQALKSKYNFEAGSGEFEDGKTASIHVEFAIMVGSKPGQWSTGSVHPIPPGNKYNIERALELIERLAVEVTTGTYDEMCYWAIPKSNTEAITSALILLFSGQVQSKL